MRPEVPAELAAVIDKMMAKEPSRRFQTPGEVAQALAPFFKKGGVGFKSAKPEISLAGESVARQETAGAAPAPPRPARNAAPPPLPAPAAPSPRPEPMWASLIDVGKTDRSGEEAPAMGWIRCPPWIWPLVAAGVLLLGLIVAWGLVIRVKTTNGTIELVNLPRDAEVFVNGAEVAVTWPGGGKPAVITVPAGQRSIKVKKDGITVFGQEVTVQAGGDPFRVPLIPPIIPGNADSKSRIGEVSKKEAERKEEAPSPVVKKNPEPKNEGAAPVDEPEFLTTRIGQIKLKRIPAGKFLMGLPGGDEDEDEHPQHEVRITRPFYLGVYEVTQGQYQAVMGNNPSYFKGSDDLPVEQVSWSDAVKFCNKLSEREGRRPCYRIEGDVVTIAGGGYRLPTEAEWEYACRAETTTRFSFGDDVDALGQYAWYSANSNGRTHPVGKKQPNAFGLYDMHGNVWEWCWDGYDADYYKQSPAVDPPGAAQASARVFRGGGWDFIPRFARSAIRHGYGPVYRYSSLGFRLALVESGG